MADGRRYASYLLRMWQVENGDSPHWRASLEDTHTGERRGFSSLITMYKYLDRVAALTAENGETNQEERPMEG